MEILTFLLCPLSAVSLLITLSTFSFVGAINCQRTTITRHLCACLLLGTILILFVADRNYFNLPEVRSHINDHCFKILKHSLHWSIQDVCTSVGIATHYIFLAAFVWMGIEGIHLNKMVVSVLDSGRSPMTIYRITAYGIPVSIVGITYVLGYLQGQQPYGNDL